MTTSAARLAGALLVLGLAVGGKGMAQTVDWQSDTWAATDALGRELPVGPDQARPVRNDRTVGIFYFLWLGNHTTGLYDLTKILAGNPTEPQYGPVQAFHHWGEPLFGYYFSRDEWVLARHAQMLSAAGVDTVILDITNAVTYDETLLTLCRVWSGLRAKGQPTPQLAFLTHSSAAQTVQHVYDHFYRPGLYPELWFHWQGKPLMLWDGGQLPAEVADFFTLRRSWAWSDPGGWFGDGHHAWTWLDHYPQRAGWDQDPNQPEALSVCLAQHPVSNIGRSFHGGREPAPAEQAPALGLCFSEQIQRALEVDPQFVFVTGWNEWVAQRFISEGGGQLAGQPLHKGDSYFVDLYSQEFSRDIEPMAGGHGDNYYWQLVDFVRRYKGVRPTAPASTQLTSLPTPADGRWPTLQPAYANPVGLPAVRDAEGFGELRYRNDSLRNELAECRMAYTATQLVAWVRASSSLVQPETDTWMNLLLDVDGDPETGWNGYDALANRRRPATGQASLELWRNGQWVEVGTAALATEGNMLTLAMPRRLLGLDGATFTVDFKWLDNAGLPERLEDWWQQGSVAPPGRFRYRFSAG